MPSTGTASYTITRDGMIQSALRSMRVLIGGAAPSADDITAGAEELNMMLKGWYRTKLKLWCYQQIPVPMVANKVTYTIGPAAADITAVRPLRVFEYGNYIRQMIGGLPQDTPLNLLSRQEYMQFGAKLAPGVPNSIYYQPGIDVAGGLTSPSTGYGTLYVYVAPMPGIARTIYLNAQRPIYDMGSADDEFDVPSEWFTAIKYGLMARLADDYEVPEDRLKRYIEQAAMYLEAAQDTSVEEASTTFAPNMIGR